jgi:hypothetical protein
VTSPKGTKDSAASVAAVILPKLRELRRLADTVRWGLLDVIIWANEIEDDILKSNQAAAHTALDDLNLLPNEPANHEDYEPGTPYGFQPHDERDW